MREIIPKGVWLRDAQDGNVVCTIVAA